MEEEILTALLKGVHPSLWTPEENVFVYVLRVQPCLFLLLFFYKGLQLIFLF